MSPAKADSPLRKVTLNLYEDDCLWLEHTHGYGWSEMARQIIHQYVIKQEETVVQINTTIGDLFKDKL